MSCLAFTAVKYGFIYPARVYVLCSDGFSGAQDVLVDMALWFGV